MSPFNRLARSPPLPATANSLEIEPAVQEASTVTADDAGNCKSMLPALAVILQAARGGLAMEAFTEPPCRGRFGQFARLFYRNGPAFGHGQRLAVDAAGFHGAASCARLEVAAYITDGQAAAFAGRLDGTGDVPQLQTSAQRRSLHRSIEVAHLGAAARAQIQIEFARHGDAKIEAHLVAKRVIPIVRQPDDNVHIVLVDRLGRDVGLSHLDRELLPQLVHFLGRLNFVFERVFHADPVRIGGDDFDVPHVRVEIQDAARPDLKRLLDFIAPFGPGARRGELLCKSEERDERKQTYYFSASVAKRSFEDKCVPKQSLGERGFAVVAGTRFITRFLMRPWD